MRVGLSNRCASALTIYAWLSNAAGVNLWNSLHSPQLSDSSAWGVFETHFTTQTIWYLRCNVNTAAHKTDAVITLSFHCLLPLGGVSSRWPDPGMSTDDRTVGKEQRICYQWQRAVMDFRPAQNPQHSELQAVLKVWRYAGCTTYILEQI